MKIKGDVDIEGDVDVTGKIDATDEVHSDTDVTAAGVSLKNHTHTWPSTPPPGSPGSTIQPTPTG
ncbi:MAG: hypothetical protein FWC27_01735 [Firmicutes bacterium]|nr:hypothetical protein [Bacillota bacterium]